MTGLGKLFLILGAIAIAGVLLIGGGAWYWWDQHSTEFLEAGKATIAEGEKSGDKLDESGCVVVALERHKADWTRTLASVIRNGLWLTGCLDTSRQQKPFVRACPPRTTPLQPVSGRAASAFNTGSPTRTVIRSFRISRSTVIRPGGLRRSRPAHRLARRHRPEISIHDPRHANQERKPRCPLKRRKAAACAGRSGSRPDRPTRPSGTVIARGAGKPPAVRMLRTCSCRKGSSPGWQARIWYITSSCRAPGPSRYRSAAAAEAGCRTE